MRARTRVACSKTKKSSREPGGPAHALPTPTPPPRPRAPHGSTRRTGDEEPQGGPERPPHGFRFRAPLASFKRSTNRSSKPWVPPSCERPARDAGPMNRPTAEGPTSRSMRFAAAACRPSWHRRHARASSNLNCNKGQATLSFSKLRMGWDNQAVWQRCTCRAPSVRPQAAAAAAAPPLLLQFPRTAPKRRPIVQCALQCISKGLGKKAARRREACNVKLAMEGSTCNRTQS